ncbi:hypothetical protein RB213_005936, partial [Colletotrichum asianum]
GRSRSDLPQAGPTTSHRIVPHRPPSSALLATPIVRPYCWLNEPAARELCREAEAIDYGLGLLAAQPNRINDTVITLPFRPPARSPIRRDHYSSAFVCTSRPLYRRLRPSLPALLTRLRPGSAQGPYYNDKVHQLAA